MELSGLRNRHQGETVWVLGSGPSLNFIDPSFFDGKTVVSTNLVAQQLGIRAQYAFAHHHEDAHKLLGSADFVVTLTHDTDLPRLTWQFELHPSLVFIRQDYVDPVGEYWDVFGQHRPAEDTLVYGSSSLHGSMHLAAWVGAAHIVLVGADCGAIDGAHRLHGYPQGDQPWAIYNRHHKAMKDWLVETYGVTVYSLNPFINLHLEGHQFYGG
jgi:hypothetical protein